ncbi:hypothetical protein [Corynebacterium sp.]|uniref:hypothetical protein n=1 Tax=Corynebacterium sp. TaxID=1720 RepID=UPI0026DD2788|nr:hypothetical protein [Corynebacterium sp.]MDO5077343.1 hypothetical protein [Corynebacterium sp.]
MSAALPPLDPALAAAALEQLAPRLLKRAEKLAAESETWTVSTENGLRVTIGQATVTLTDSLHCDCLLAPRCAHIGAVCVASPVGEATAAPEVAEPEPASDPAEGAAWAKTLPAPALVIEVAESADSVVAAVLQHGIGQLSIQQHAQLLACVQRARVCGLPRLERALTALATCSQTMRMGRPIGRAEATLATFRLAYLCYRLQRDPGDRQAIGQARRSYDTLDAQSGVGAGKFIPLYAEPIVTASGFAGVTVVLATANGNLYSVTKTPPGTAADVLGVWHGPVRLGDLHSSHAQLAGHVLMITGGKASSDGRIGSGKGVRAALGKPVTLDMVQQLPLGDGLAVVDGEMTAIGMKHLTLQLADGAETKFEFSVAARKTEVKSLVEACQRLLSNDVAIPCACLVRDAQLLCLWPLDESFALPPEFCGRVFPGLDRVPAPALLNKYAEQSNGQAEVGTAQRSVVELITSWLARSVFGGEQMIVRRGEELARDAAHLERVAAPFAATLLRRLPHGTHAALALALYAHDIT